MKYTIKLNESKKTYTIREYDENGKLVQKFRTLKQECVTKDWTEQDIKIFLRYNNGDYYKVK